MVCGAIAAELFRGWPQRPLGRSRPAPGRVGVRCSRARCARTPAGSCRRAARAGSYSSDSRPRSLRSASSRSNISRASSSSAEQDEVVDEPERAEARTRLRRAAGRPRLVAPRRAGSDDEAVLQQLRARIASSVPRARAGRRPAGSRRAGSSAGSRRAASSRSTGRTSRARRRSRARSTSAWISSRTRRQRSTGPSRPNCSDGLDAAVERDPGHHLRVGEVAARPAHLPDPLVGLVPAPLEVQRADALERPRLRRPARCRAARAWWSTSMTSP